MARARHLAPIILYAVLAILVVPVFPHFVSSNEFSRWVLAVAIVDFHTVEATPVVTSTHTRMEDLATVDGRLYSNKAPGGALVGLPAYVIARAIVGPPSPHNMRATLNAMRLLGSTVPAILLALWLGIVARRFGCNEERATFAVTAMLFGTPLFAYGLLFFAHALSAFTLFGTFALLFSTEARGPRPEAWWAGVLIGIAVLSEYPSAIPAAILVLCALPRLRVAGTLRVIAGGLPFAILLGIYNKLAFGSVFTLSSAHEVDANIRELASRGLFGVGLPSPEYLMRLLLDPSKGLFVLSPVLLIALAGIRGAWKAMPRPAFIALIATPLSILLTFAGYPNWFGGWTVGARYLVAAVPFLAVLIAFAAATSIEALLLGASVTVIAIVSLVFPFVAPDYPAPWISFAWPMLRKGFVAPNLLHFVARPLAVAVPFAIVAAAAVIAVPPRRIALLIFGAVLWFAIGFPAERSRTGPPYVRALVQRVHFDDKTAIAESLPAGDPNARALEAIAARMMKVPPDAWPF
ncbi:MAG TPA: hypothetical protein VIM68_08315 [Thermoanaerobaculia bacterium]